MFEVGERVLMVYPSGDADYVEVVNVFAQVAFVKLPDGSATMTLLENLCQPEGVSNEAWGEYQGWSQEEINEWNKLDAEIAAMKENK